MAKGRKLPTTQTERFLGSYGYGNESSELAEEDVWSTVDDLSTDEEERKVSNFTTGEWNQRAHIASTRRISIKTRRNHEERHVGGLSLAFESSINTMALSPMILHQFHHRTGGSDGGREAESQGAHMATSAPVNVPDWSKIYRVDSAESMHDLDRDGLGEEAEMVPPHVYLARGRRSGTTSVYEGVGRTLKGRDLRRVRDAVWSQTGFDG